VFEKAVTISAVNFGEAVLDAVGQRLAIPPDDGHAAVDDDGARGPSGCHSCVCIGDRAGSSA
jgi:hypothetical protein